MRIFIKIVPSAEPDAAGRWIEIDPKRIDWNHHGTTWVSTAAMFDPVVPAGFHLVAYESTTDDKQAAKILARTDRSIPHKAPGAGRHQEKDKEDVREDHVGGGCP